MTHLTCALDGCEGLLDGLKASAVYCSSKCRDRANYLRNGPKVRAAARARHERLRDDPEYKARRAAQFERWSAVHAARRSETAAARYARDKDRILAVARAWKREHPDNLRTYEKVRRARKRNAPRLKFTTAELSARMLYFDNRCWMCGEKANSLDHVKPLSRGGQHMLSNLRPACISCNSSKREKWLGPRWSETLKRAS